MKCEHCGQRMHSDTWHTCPDTPMQIIDEITDTDRLNWLDAHPGTMEIHGGIDDGGKGKAWVVAAHSGTLREAIDILMQRT